MLPLVATFWRYVRIQLMVFVFGIVGPIFLVVFFATQPDPTMKWAYWAGLFITAADVLIALALTNASDPKRVPAGVRRPGKLSAHIQAGSGDSFSSNTYDPFSSNAFSFSTDSSSSGGYSSSDSGSSGDYSSSGD